eukprot:NODE_1815_length_546_cov_226.484634_g1801_i0.p1 GENE.NODE_1815_length_546_cov_226.484634_g1801_i0~~NODE_1815_length_546_cov_226.484634_g1801_i0.p1  ORF type:complete len:153 (+),score=24.26 NODE_1815_length_546_cov_226.484634_g1801_i0:38-460(+)
MVMKTYQMVEQYVIEYGFTCTFARPLQFSADPVNDITNLRSRWKSQPGPARPLDRDREPEEVEERRDPRQYVLRAGAEPFTLPRLHLVGDVDMKAQQVQQLLDIIGIQLDMVPSAIHQNLTDNFEQLLFTANSLLRPTDL